MIGCQLAIKIVNWVWQPRIPQEYQRTYMVLDQFGNYQF